MPLNVIHKLSTYCLVYAIVLSKCMSLTSSNLALHCLQLFYGTLVKIDVSRESLREYDMHLALQDRLNAKRKPLTSAFVPQPILRHGVLLAVVF